MAATQEGAIKAAAAKLNITPEEWKMRRGRDEKWCCGCKEWHHISAFRKDRSRGDGLTAACAEFSNIRNRATYKPKPRARPGRQFVQPRNDDKKQARRRVNHLVDEGLLSRPNSLPCAACGHKWEPGEKRHEMHHHQGYGCDSHEKIVILCSTCHHKKGGNNEPELNKN